MSFLKELWHYHDSYWSKCNFIIVYVVLFKQNVWTEEVPPHNNEYAENFVFSVVKVKMACERNCVLKKLAWCNTFCCTVVNWEGGH